MAKAVRRDMRRAMGEHAVMQVEAQTDALGAHETRLHALEDEVARCVYQLGHRRSDALDERRRVDALEGRLRLLDASVDAAHRLLDENLDRRLVIGRTIWTRLRWLLTGR